jgi:hypothetical protein
LQLKPPIGNDPGLHAKLPLFKWQWPLAVYGYFLRYTDIVEKGTEAIPTTAATTATIASIVNVFVIFYLENIDIILLGRNQSSCLFYGTIRVSPKLWLLTTI